MACCPGEKVFQVAGKFRDEWVKSRINEQEAYALRQLLVLLYKERPEQVQGLTLMIDVDFNAMFFAAKNGRSSNMCMHEIVTELFWLYVESDFTLEVQWVRSKDNAQADGLSRQDGDAYVRLEESTFGELCAWAGRDLDMDLMATQVLAQRLPGREVSLPFYSHFPTDSCAGVNFLGQDLRRILLAYTLSVFRIISIYHT